MNKNPPYQESTAQTKSCFLLVSGRCTSLCRCQPVAQFCKLPPHTAESAPPDSGGVAGSAGIQTWLAGLGTGPVGALQQKDASGGDKSKEKKNKNKDQQLHQDDAFCPIFIFEHKNTDKKSCVSQADTHCLSNIGSLF